MPVLVLLCRAAESTNFGRLRLWLRLRPKNIDSDSDSVSTPTSASWEVSEIEVAISLRQFSFSLLAIFLHVKQRYSTHPFASNPMVYPAGRALMMVPLNASAWQTEIYWCNDHDGIVFICIRCHLSNRIPSLNDISPLHGCCYFYFLPIFRCLRRIGSRSAKLSSVVRIYAVAPARSRSRQNFTDSRSDSGSKTADCDRLRLRYRLRLRISAARYPLRHLIHWKWHCNHSAPSRQRFLGEIGLLPQQGAIFFRNGRFYNNILEETHLKKHRNCLAKILLNCKQYCLQHDYIVWCPLRTKRVFSLHRL